MAEYIFYMPENGDGGSIPGEESRQNGAVIIGMQDGGKISEAKEI